MNCDFKAMIKLTGGLGVILTVAYFSLPEARVFILSGTPVLLAFVFPVSMLVMMFAMKSVDGTRSDGAAKPGEAGAHVEARDAAHDGT